MPVTGCCTERPIAECQAISDDQLMVSLKHGSTAAFDVLYARYGGRAYRVARSVCRDDGRAQEAVQEAFVSLWSSRATYEDRGSVSAWVLSMVRHRAVDVARRNDPHAMRRAGEDMLQTVHAPGCVAEHVANRALARDLLNVLASLPDAQREVITLAFYGQLTHLEIAAHLDLPLGTVKGRLRLGMQRLRGDIDLVGC